MEEDILKRITDDEIRITKLEEVYKLSTEINKIKNTDENHTKTKRNRRKNDGPKALIYKLISEKPWADYKPTESIIKEMKSAGYTNFTKYSIDMALLRLVREGILERRYIQSNKNQHKRWEFKIKAK